MGALVLLVSYGIARLLRPAPPEPAPPSAADLERASAIVTRAPRTSAHLALLGDKAFLFSGSGNAFIMYDVEGRERALLLLFLVL